MVDESKYLHYAAFWTQNDVKTRIEFIKYYILIFSAYKVHNQTNRLYINYFINSQTIKVTVNFQPSLKSCQCEEKREKET